GNGSRRTVTFSGVRFKTEAPGWMGRLVMVVPSQWVDASGLFRVRFFCWLDHFVVRNAIQHERGC
ncbi:MAG: hypothetical protein O7G28_11015, partial [Deltaproteobacteria bacterium]|nr:hypothetical protein [Deltaproteobacteria bacterium]